MEHFKHYLKHFKALDARGVSHLLVPLLLVLGVGVGGTYMLVASHADPISSQRAGSNSTKPQNQYPCPGGTDSTTGGTFAPTKCDVTLRILPEAGYSNGKKTIVGYVGLTAKNAQGTEVNLSKNNCTNKSKSPDGNISTAIGDTPVFPWVANFGYLGPNIKLPDGTVTKVGSCLVRLNVFTNNQTGNVKIVSTFFGNKYLKQATATRYFDLPDHLPAVLTTSLHFKPQSKKMSEIDGTVTVKVPGKYLSKGECNGKVTVIFWQVPNAKTKTGTAREAKTFSIDKFVVPKASSAQPQTYCKVSNVKYQIRAGERYFVQAKIEDGGAPYLTAPLVTDRQLLGFNVPSSLDCKNYAGVNLQCPIVK